MRIFKDKKAFVRTLEVFIAVVVTFIFINFVIPLRTATDVTASSTHILEVLEQNDDFRDCVVEYNITCINNSIDYYLPDAYSFTFNVSDDPNIGVPDLPRKEVLVDSIFVAGNISAYTPRIVRVYYWVG